MEVLWEKDEATVAEVTAALPPPPSAYNSVLTTLRILGTKRIRRARRGRPRLRLSAVARA